MKNSNQSFVAFFSYVRRNDEHDKGRLTTFRKLLEAELWSQTGKDLQVFQDKEDIEWGDNWRERITKVLDSCTFLIVMVTPGYLESQSCRFEFEYFLKHESLSEYKNLILPILYIDTPELRSSNDPIAIEISKRQWVDWRDTRFASLTSTKVNKKIASLANRIRVLIDDKGMMTSLPNVVNFPNNWETQWQPSFDESAMASSPKPKFTEKEEATNEAIVTSLKSIYVPLAKAVYDDYLPKQITINLRSLGNKDADRRRIKTIYGLLISFHGRDRFSFHILENSGKHLIDFPNDTTRICPELLTRLEKLMGEENWRVEEITFQ